MTTKARYRGGVLEYFESATHERVGRLAPVAFADDFLGAGATAVPALSSAESGVRWVKAIVGAAPPTVAGVADAAGGVMECALTSASQAQTAALLMDDQRQFDLTKGLIFEARCKVSVLPTLLAEAVVGLMGDNGVPDDVLYSAFFTADGSGEIFCEADDNATDQSATSGITVLATAWHIYRIEFTSLTDIRFYIDGNHVATGTTFVFAATGADAILQPWLGLYKASGAGLGTLQVDYVRLWQNRS